MHPYTHPQRSIQPPLAPNTAWLVASGDLRAQRERHRLADPGAAGARTSPAALAALGWTVRRAHAVDDAQGTRLHRQPAHGASTSSQRFPPDAPLDRRGGRLAVQPPRAGRAAHPPRADPDRRQLERRVRRAWSGMLNLNGSPDQGRACDYSTLWSEDFTDDWVRRRACEAGSRPARVAHDTSHVRDLPPLPTSAERPRSARRWPASCAPRRPSSASSTRAAWACTTPSSTTSCSTRSGIYKERLSQSALVAEMLTGGRRGGRTPSVPGSTTPGMTFHTGTDEATELTDAQIRSASSRCTSPRCGSPTTSAWTRSASSTSRVSRTSCPPRDLAEGLLNNVERPPVTSRDGIRELYAGQALPHFNEVDEGVGRRRARHQPGLDGDGPRPGDDPARRPLGRAVRGRLRLGVRDLRIGARLPLRWRIRRRGQHAPEPPSTSRPGGGTLSGVCKPGEIVWSRVFIMDGRCTSTLAAAPSSSCPQRRPSGAGPPPPRSGRSCTRCCTASAATS